MSRMPPEQKQKSHQSVSARPPKRQPQYDQLDLNYHNIKAAFARDPVWVRYVCEAGVLDVLHSPLKREPLRYIKSDARHISSLSRECGHVPLPQIKLTRGSLLGYECSDLETLQRSQL